MILTIQWIQSLDLDRMRIFRQDHELVLAAGYTDINPTVSLSQMKCRFACIDELREEVHRREGFMQFQPDKLCLGFRNFVHHR